MRMLLVLLILTLPIGVLAQHTISGKVINMYDKKPIANASVFLGNTTVGNITGEDGSYLLSSIKSGQYDLVISAVGYEIFHQTINVNSNLVIAYTELNPRTINLNAVEVKPDLDWEQNYRQFKEEIYGPTPFAAQCKILNPEVLNLAFNGTQSTLTASSNDYLIIENKALGYTIKYYLTDFVKDYRAGTLFYQGNTLFVPMKGSPAQIRQWRKNRLEAYLGSTTHYLRSLVGNKLIAEGFNTFTLYRKPNPARPPDSIIKAKIRTFFTSAQTNGSTISMQKNDSLNYWSAKNRLPKTVDYLSTKMLKVDSLVKRTDVKGIYALGYEETLYIVYTNKKITDPQKLLKKPEFPTSMVHFKEPYAFFDLNGVITNPASVMFEGTWGLNRLAVMLPIDYDPTEGKN